jgi:hypothetical protein
MELETVAQNVHGLISWLYMIGVKSLLFCMLCVLRTDLATLKLLQEV